MASILDDLIARQEELARFRSQDRRDNAFPRDAYGRLTNPDYIREEGERILASIAAGEFGAQLQRPGAAVAPVMVDPNAVTTGRFGNSFFNQPSMWEQNRDPAQLRQDLKLDELTTVAAQRKFDLERAQQRAPMEDLLLQAQINASGSHDRFLREQDQQTLQHTAGFFDAMTNPNAPAPQDSGYRDYVLGTLARNPRFAETTGGKDFLQKLADTEGTHISMADIKKNLPAGFNVASVRIGPKGPAYELKPAGADVVKALEDNYGLKPGDLSNPTAVKIGRVGASGGFQGDEKGEFVQITKSNGSGSVIMPIADYERFGGKYSPGTQQARAGVQGAAEAIDLMALAREALADPNATEAERAAARKRLGQ